jgi:tetratricopeptide (TPR) repeat protein
MRSKYTRFILAAFPLLILCGPRNLVANSFKEHMNNARDFMSKGDFDGAITEYEKALQGKRHSIEAQAWLGIAYMELGNRQLNNGETDRAIEAYGQALALVPRDPYWHEQLARALQKKGDHKAAMKEHGTATALLPLDGGLQSNYTEFINGDQAPVDADLRMARTGERIELVGGEISEPTPIYKPDPVLTERDRRAGVQGTLSLWAVIDGEGNVVETILLKPLEWDVDSRSLETIRTWKFHPAMRNGAPIPVRVIIEVEFRFLVSIWTVNCASRHG